jgi:hypothetical protein
MPIAYAAFRSRFSVQSRRGFHAARLEAGALNLGLRVVTRSARCQRQRLLVLVDSQALMYAARKGRSSGECFVMGLRGVSAHALAADLKLHYGYTPSRHNAADPPSRGKRLHERATGASVSCRSSHCVRRLVAHGHTLKRAVRRFVKCGTMQRPHGWAAWSLTCSESELAQPSDR